MEHLSIDIETKSSVDIGKAGLYRYAQSDDFEILSWNMRIILLVRLCHIWLTGQE